MLLIYRLLSKDSRLCSKGISSSLSLSSSTSSKLSSTLLLPSSSLSTLSLSKLYSPFKRNYDKKLVYDNKKSDKSMMRRTIDSITGKKTKELENDDIAILEQLAILPKSLSSILLDIDHPLYNIANDVRNSIKYNADLTSDFNSIRVKVTIEAAIAVLENNFSKYKIDIINFYYDENWKIVTNNDTNTYRQQTALRILNCELYLRNLLKLLINGDLKYSSINENKLMQICDAFLIGKASDRILEHLSLYASEFSQWQMQDSFYQIYEQEVSAVAKIFLLARGLRKMHFKNIPNYSRSYLLDVLDLNMKSRCVFAWADPNFTGLKPLPDDHVIALDTLLISRRLYFNDSLDIGSTFAKDYLGSRRAVYADKKDTKDTLKNGFYFTIVTCLLDWGVCTL